MTLLFKPSVNGDLKSRRIANCPGRVSPNSANVIDESRTALQLAALRDSMSIMKRLALSALILLIPALVRADEKDTMLQTLGQFEQAWRSTTPCQVSSNACQTREIWLAQQAARAADQYLNTPDAKESPWRLVAQSIIKYSQARSEAYAAYVQARNQDPDAAEKAYHSIVDPLEQDFMGQLKATLRSDENSREIAQRFGLVDF
jgi:hypothetical protein